MNIFKKKKNMIDEIPYELTSPANGEVIDITEVNDPAFKSKAMGDGVGIKSDEKSIVSPISGEITVVFPTKHAYGITTPTGIEVLVHIGVDTVELGGKGFECFVKQGQHINRGDKLCTVDYSMLKESGYDTTIIMVITNTTQFSEIKKSLGSKKTTDSIIKIEK